jgi:hypothetical protein
MSAYGPSPAAGIPGLGQAQKVGKSDPEKKRRQKQPKDDKAEKKPAEADSVELHDTGATDGATGPTDAETPAKKKGGEQRPHIDLKG